MSVQSEFYRDHEIIIDYESSCDSPRDFDNVAVFVCEHPHYELGDVHNIKSELNDLIYKHFSDKQIIDYFCEIRNGKYIDDDNGTRYEYWAKDCFGGQSKFYINADEYGDYIATQMLDELDVSEKYGLVSRSNKIVISPISIYDHSGVTIWLGYPNDRWDSGIIGFSYIEKDVALKYNNRLTDEDWQSWAENEMKQEMKIYDYYVRGEVYYYYIEGEGVICPSGEFYGYDSIDKMIELAKAEIDAYYENKAKTREELLDTVCKEIDDLIGVAFAADSFIYLICSNLFSSGYIERVQMKNDRALGHCIVPINEMPTDVLQQMDEYCHSNGNVWQTEQYRQFKLIKLN